MNLHIDFNVEKDCQNLYDSYGQICVHCNCCGRFNKETMNDCRIKFYKRMLQEHVEKIDNPDYAMEIQKKNILKDIIYFAEEIGKIRKLEMECEEI